MRKLSLIASILSLPLFAESDTLVDKVSLLECKMKSARTDTVYEGRAGAKYANGRPVYTGWGVWATGEVLYWKAFQGAPDYSYTNNSSVTSWMQGNVHRVSYDWQAGYRLGLSYAWPYDNWDMSALYTSIDPNGDGNSTAPTQGNLGSIYNSHDIISGRASNAYWKTAYSVLDFEFGRDFFISKYIFMRPFFGVRGAWVHQKLKANFTTSTEQEQVRNRNDFNGAGLRIGNEGKWFLDKHWNLSLLSSASLLYGAFKVNNKRTKFAGSTPNFQTTESGNASMMVPAAQMSLGLGWETLFADDRNHISFNVSYELNYWWRQNQTTKIETTLSAPYGSRYSNDLGLHGVTGDIQLSF